MPDYLDRHEFHAEMTRCKHLDKLTDEALEMFEKLAVNVSRDFYFERADDKKDAEGSAMHDLFKYWRNFKESNVIRMKIRRNFRVGDFFRVDIYGKGTITYKAADVQDPKNRKFKIGDTINYSIENLKSVMEEMDDELLELYVDKIKKNITFMDKYNGDDKSRKSCVSVNSEMPVDWDDIEKDDVVVKEMNDDLKILVYKGYDEEEQVVRFKLSNQELEFTLDQIKDIRHPFTTPDTHGFTFYFKPPPNAFSYFTSITRNGVLKSINKTNPKKFRNGKKISIERTNEKNNGLYSI